MDNWAGICTKASQENYLLLPMWQRRKQQQTD